MKIPNSSRKKALFIVDVQDGFLIERNRSILPNIQKLIESGIYDCIVYSLSYNEEGSVWYSQIGWCENPKDNDIAKELQNILPVNNVYKVHKLTRSIFKADEDVGLILQKHQIEEVHICGLTTYDCVYATAQESSDLGYFTFVIEETCEARTTYETHTKAIENLRYMALTNNSEFVGYKTMKFLEL